MPGWLTGWLVVNWLFGEFGMVCVKLCRASLASPIYAATNYASLDLNGFLCFSTTPDTRCCHVFSMVVAAFNLVQIKFHQTC
jgi:hypothetical protein